MSRWTLPLCSGKAKTGPLGRMCPHPGTSQSSEKGFPSGTVTCKAVLGGSAAGGAAVRRGQGVWNEAGLPYLLDLPSLAHVCRMAAFCTPPIRTPPQPLNYLSPLHLLPSLSVTPPPVPCCPHSPACSQTTVLIY